jgi:hypothetical protein
MKPLEIIKTAATPEAVEAMVETPTIAWARTSGLILGAAKTSASDWRTALDAAYDALDDQKVAPLRRDELWSVVLLVELSTGPGVLSSSAREKIARAIETDLQGSRKVPFFIDEPVPRLFGPISIEPATEPDGGRGRDELEDVLVSFSKGDPELLALLKKTLTVRKRSMENVNALLDLLGGERNG